jgi:hypothetical protein
MVSNNFYLLGLFIWLEFSFKSEFVNHGVGDGVGMRSTVCTFMHPLELFKQSLPLLGEFAFVLSCSISFVKIQNLDGE